MNCELVQSQLLLLLDGELAADTAANVERHLEGCPACTQAHADLAAVREMAAAWAVDAPDISARVMQAIAADDQLTLLDEIRELRMEIAALRAEVSTLRRRLPPRPETSWALPTHHDPLTDYPRMENDPWNLIRS